MKNTTAAASASGKAAPAAGAASTGGAAPPVRFETRAAGGTATASGRRKIGIAWLNRPHLLNALDLDMCELLVAQLGAWAVDDSVVAVVLAGDGCKGFCAGGDVSRVVREINGGGAHRFAYGDRFFSVEYQLNYLMHTFAKPLVTWAHGATMGGGLGLSVAGSHRIVATGSKLAMPEIHIGLFPDVGGGWFLNRVPGEAGLLIALTGVVMNERDAVYARLADYVLDHALQPAFLDAFAAIDWGDTVVDHRVQSTHFCRRFEAAHASSAAASALQERYAQIRAT